MNAQAEHKRPRIVHNERGTFLILTRALPFKTAPAELGQGRYVADVYRLDSDAGTRAKLVLLATGRPAPVERTATDYASERLREIMRKG